MDAPPALNVAVEPLQIVAEAAVIVGFAFTVIVLTAVLELKQPSVLVPVIEYEVVVAGVTVNVPPLIV